MSTPPISAVDPVRDYLAAMERRDPDAARALLAPESSMDFAGDRFTVSDGRLTERLVWSDLAEVRGRDGATR